MIESSATVDNILRPPNPPRPGGEGGEDPIFDAAPHLEQNDTYRRGQGRGGGKQLMDSESFGPSPKLEFVPPPRGKKKGKRPRGGYYRAPVLFHPEVTKVEGKGDVVIRN